VPITAAKNLRNALAILCGIGALSAVLAQEQKPARSPSVWDGVYSEKQAAIGKARYVRTCSECHGDDLEGDIVEHPQLAGGDFVDKWNGLDLGQLFERIHRDMPMDRPGSLDRETSVDLIAYILSANRFPAGEYDLPRDPEILKQIRIEREPPASGNKTSEKKP
jgi:mono/diheme cytochrome c family protein